MIFCRNFFDNMISIAISVLVNCAEYSLNYSTIVLLFAGRLLIFFSIFYTAVVFMSLTFWWIFSLTLNPRTPTHLAPDSLIGTNPGKCQQNDNRMLC